MKVKLVVVNGAKAGLEIPISVSKYNIGWANDCHLRLDKESVSQKHCVISVDRGAVGIEDAGSASGTFVNGQRLVWRRRLQDKDRIIVGNLEFEIRLISKTDHGKSEVVDFSQQAGSPSTVADDCSVGNLSPTVETDPVSATLNLSPPAPMMPIRPVLQVCPGKEQVTPLLQEEGEESQPRRGWNAIDYSLLAATAIVGGILAMRTECMATFGMAIVMLAIACVPESGGRTASINRPRRSGFRPRAIDLVLLGVCIVPIGIGEFLVHWSADWWRGYIEALDFGNWSFRTWGEIVAMWCNTILLISIWPRGSRRIGTVVQSTQSGSPSAMRTTPIVAAMLFSLLSQGLAVAQTPPSPPKKPATAQKPMEPPKPAVPSKPATAPKPAVPKKDPVSKEFAELFQEGEYHYTGGKYNEQPFRYRLFVPSGVNSHRRYPLLVWLHGAGEAGSDNRLSLLYLNQLISDPERLEKYRFFMLVVQCPRDNVLWYHKYDPTKSTADGSEDMLTVAVNILQKTMQEQPIDPDRIYWAGLSTGGNGCWELAMRHPELVAGMVPMSSSYLDLSNAAKLANIPIWAVVNEGERKNVETMVEALKAANGSAYLTVLDAKGHNSWSWALKNEEIWTWLLAQHKGAWARWTPAPMHPWKWSHVLTVPILFLLTIRATWWWRQRRFAIESQPEKAPNPTLVKKTTPSPQPKVPKNRLAQKPASVPQPVTVNPTPNPAGTPPVTPTPVPAPEAGPQKLIQNNLPRVSARDFLDGRR